MPERLTLRERLERLEQSVVETRTAVTAHDTRTGERMEQLGQSVEALREEVRCLSHGEGGQPGLVIRVDRLEQEESRRRWQARTALGAAIAAMVGWIFDAFRGS